MKINKILKAKIDRIIALESLTDYLAFTSPEEYFKELQQLRKEVLPEIREFVKSLVNAQLINFVLDDPEGRLPHESLFFTPKLCSAEEGEGIYVHAEFDDHVCEDDDESDSPDGNKKSSEDEPMN